MFPRKLCEYIVKNSVLLDLLPKLGFFLMELLYYRRPTCVAVRSEFCCKVVILHSFRKNHPESS